jgi:hypothetical protein
MGLYQAMRRRVLRKAIEPVALAFEALANEMHDGLPPDEVMTRDEVVKLLRGVAATMRTTELP